MNEEITKNKKVKIKKSNLNGMGLFATQNYKIGDLIIKWNITDIINKNDLKNIDTKYVIYIDNIYINMKSPEKYANHSCIPNAISKNFSYIAIKEIKENEEITIKYSNKLPLTENCNCKFCKSRNK